MLRRDHRRKQPCWEVANWAKWQVEHGLAECSSVEQQGVQALNSDGSECSTAEQQCSSAEHEEATDEHQCSTAEQVSADGECASVEQQEAAGQGAQRPRIEVYPPQECSSAEQPIEVKSTTENSREDAAPPPSTLMEQCNAILEPLTGAKRDPKAEATISNAMMLPSAEDVILEVCMTLAAKFAAGKPARIDFIPNNVGDALRRLKKQEARDPSPDPDNPVPETEEFREAQAYATERVALAPPDYAMESFRVPDPGEAVK